MDQRLPELNPVVTPALTDILGARQSGDTRDKRETAAQILSLYVEVNDLTAAVVWANIPDANVPESAVTQHVGALEHSSLLNVPSTISQAEAEAGVATTDRLFTAERVGQAIAALAGSSDPLLLSDGTNLAPTYSFASDPDTGFYSSGADLIDVALGGARSWIFQTIAFQSLTAAGPVILAESATATNPTLCPSSSGLTTGIGAAAEDQLSLIAGGVEGIRITEAAAVINIATSGPVLAPDGSAGAPTYAFSASPTTGIYSAAANRLTFAVSGTGKFQFRSDNFESMVGNGPVIFNEAATATNPTLTPHSGDPSTGIGAHATSNLSLIASGVEALRCVNEPGIDQVIISPGVIPNDAATPSLAFGNGDTGFYELSDNTLAVSIAGTVQFGWAGTKFVGITGTAGGINNTAVTATNPSILAIQNDVNTGLGSAGADQLTLVAGGVEGLRVSEVGAVITLDAKGSVVGVNGTSSIPAFAFASEVNSGLYRQGAGVFMFSIGGSGKWVFRGTSFDGNVADGPRLMFEGATATNPVYVFLGDTDSGLGWAGADTVSLIAGGVEGMRITEAAAVITATLAGNLTITGDILANQAAGPGFLNEDATATNPTLVPNQADPDTGIGRTNVDQLAMVCGGIEAGRFEDPADLSARDTSLWVYDLDNGQMEQVSVGDADSGGTGYKLLRVLN